MLLIIFAFINPCKRNSYKGHKIQVSDTYKSLKIHAKFTPHSTTSLSRLLIIKPTPCLFVRDRSLSHKETGGFDISDAKEERGAQFFSVP